MNEIVWPCDQMKPSHQVVAGYTVKDAPPAFMKYGCSVHKIEAPVEVKGKRVRNERGQFAAVMA